MTRPDLTIRPMITVIPPAEPPKQSWFWLACLVFAGISAAFAVQM